MCCLMLAEWRTMQASRAASSVASIASMKAVVEHLASITNTPPPGRRTFTSGRRRPSSVSMLNCSRKSKRAVSPAISRTLRSACSPQRPCTPAPRRSAWDSLRASAWVSVEACIRAVIWARRPPVSSARLFSISWTCSSNFFSVSATGLSCFSSSDWASWARAVACSSARLISSSWALVRVSADRARKAWPMLALTSSRLRARASASAMRRPDRASSCARPSARARSRRASPRKYQVAPPRATAARPSSRAITEEMFMPCSIARPGPGRKRPCADFAGGGTGCRRSGASPVPEKEPRPPPSGSWVRLNEPGTDSDGREGLWTSIQGCHPAPRVEKMPINRL